MKSDHIVGGSLASAAPLPAPALSPLEVAGLLLCSALALSLAFAPVSLFFFAWFALVPFLLAMRSLKSQLAAFVWGWACGILFFAINMYWLGFVTIAGAIALPIYLGIFWGMVAMLVRGAALMGRWDVKTQRALPPKRPLRCALLIAAMWCGLEWVRGSFSPFGAYGLPWLFVGASQAPILATCQIADFTGVYGVSFWVILLNAAFAMVWIDRARLGRLWNLMFGVVVIVAMLTGYGFYRLWQRTIRPGPVVMVVQSNYPQSNTGAKGATYDQIVDFHVSTTDAALADCEQRGEHVDLVAWSETMMPPLNEQTRTYMRGSGFGNFLEQTSQKISGVADRYRTSLLVGSTFADDYQIVTLPNGRSMPQASDRRNSAYLYGPTGLMAAERYDKIQLLPFGEFVPYRDSFPWLYRILVSLGPPDLKQYQLTAGTADAPTVFSLDQVPRADPAASEPVIATPTWSFVTPICFEDLLSPLVRHLVWGPAGKRADFLVNITNDGWFRGSERPQHLQNAIFRCIENRVPAARSVNTGISGFIDSVGRTGDTIEPRTQGWSVKQLQLDERTPFYGRFGDVFAELCSLIWVAIVIYGLSTRIKNRRRRGSMI